MSNFNCETCGALHIDTERGYVTGCWHYGRECDACGQRFMIVPNSKGWLYCPHCWHGKVFGEVEEKL